MSHSRHIDADLIQELLSPLSHFAAIEEAQANEVEMNFFAAQEEIRQNIQMLGQ